MCLVTAFVITESIRKNCLHPTVRKLNVLCRRKQAICLSLCRSYPIYRCGWRRDAAVQCFRVWQTSTEIHLIIWMPWILFEWENASLCSSMLDRNIIDIAHSVKSTFWGTLDTATIIAIKLTFREERATGSLTWPCDVPVAVGIYANAEVSLVNRSSFSPHAVLETRSKFSLQGISLTWSDEWTWTWTNAGREQ